MSLLTPAIRYLSRKRHARGFGIHSPFAFSFVCKVLGEKARYYAYDIIERKAGEETRRKDMATPSVRILKMLFRMVNYFRPDIILTAGTLGEATLTALLEPDSRTGLVRLTPGETVPEEYETRISTEPSFSLSAQNGLMVIGTVDERDSAPAIRSAMTMIREEMPVVMLDAGSKSGAEVLKTCASSMERGMIFHNDGSVAIIVPFRRLPRQDFRISL